MRGRLAAALVASFLAGTWLGVAWAESPRRPITPPWADETAGWQVGSAVKSGAVFPESDHAEALTLQSPADSPERYIYGSAFAVSDNGLWLTARQYIDNCRALFIEGGSSPKGTRRLLVIEVEPHPQADVAVLRTAGARLEIEPVPVAPPDVEAGEAFHVGFPQGRPAAIHGQLIGRTKLRHIGTPVENEALVWAEQGRIPDFAGDLGGLEGGLVLSPDRRAIGTVSGESPRRGRILTIQTARLWDVLRRRKEPVAPAQESEGSRVTPQTFPPTARNLVQQRRVARLVCETRRGLALRGSARR